MSDGQLTPLAILLTLILTVSLFLIPSVTHSDFITKSAANYDHLALLKTKVHLKREKQLEFIYNRTVDEVDRENDRLALLDDEHTALRAFHHFSPTQSSDIDTRTLPPYMDVMRFAVTTITRPVDRREDSPEPERKHKKRFNFSSSILDPVPRESISIGQRFKLVETNLDESASDIESDPFDPDNFMLGNDVQSTNKLQSDSSHNREEKYFKKLNHSSSSSSKSRERVPVKIPHLTDDSILPFPYLVKKLTKSSGKSADYLSTEDDEKEPPEGDQVRSYDLLLNRDVITPEHRDRDDDEDDEEKNDEPVEKETHDTSIYEDEATMPTTPPGTRSFGKKLKSSKESKTVKQSVKSVARTKKERIKSIKVKSNKATDVSPETVRVSEVEKKKNKAHKDKDKDKKKKLTSVKYPTLREKSSSPSPSSSSSSSSRKSKDCPCLKDKAASTKKEKEQIQRHHEISDRSCDSGDEEKEDKVAGETDEDSPLEDLKSELKPQLISPYDLPQHERDRETSPKGHASSTSSSTTSTSTSTSTTTTTSTSTTSTTRRPSSKSRAAAASAAAGRGGKKSRTASSVHLTEKDDDALLNELSTEYYDHADVSRSKHDVNDIILDEVNDGLETNDADNRRKSISRLPGHLTIGERRLNLVNYDTHKYSSNQDVFTTYVPSSSPRYFKSLLVSMRRLPFSSSPLSSSPSLVSSSTASGHRNNYQAETVSLSPDVTSVDSVTLRTKPLSKSISGGRNGRSNKSNRYTSSYRNIDPQMIINSRILPHRDTSARDEGEIAWMNEPTVDISTSTSSSSIYYDV